ALLRSEAIHRALLAPTLRSAPLPRARQPWPGFPAARVAFRGVVLARRGSGNRGSVLPGASAPRAARAAHHARGGRRQQQVGDANPAPRGGPRSGYRITGATP